MQRAINILKYLYEMHRPFRRTMSFILFLLVFGQVIFLLRPLLQGKIIDALVHQGSLTYFVTLFASLACVYLIGTLLNFLREFYEWKDLYYDLERYINLKTLTRLALFSIGQHSNEHSGLRQSTIGRGKAALRSLSESLTYNLLPIVIQIMLTSVAILIASWQVGLIVIISSGIYLTLSIRHNASFYKNMKKNSDDWQDLSKKESEILRHFPLIKAEAQEKNTIEDYFSGVYPIETFAKKIWIDHSKHFHAYSLFIEMSQIAALFVGIMLVRQGFYSPGIIVTLIGWIGSIFGNMGNLGRLQRSALRQAALIERYMETLEIPPAVTEKQNAISIHEIKGVINFENVVFAYPVVELESDKDERKPKKPKPKKRDTLKGVSFTINAGETVALVGHSGAGKTTIIQLLLRGYDPQQGSIKIDSHDLRDIKLKEYLHHIGYVEQSVRLFDGTLRENIIFGLADKSTVTEKEIDAVARKARIDQFYDRLGEEKFETKIGENGIWLSGGERQRVGIARALIKNPQILIFDEATSSLDAENEALIHEAMREALKGRTGIIIAHRLSTIRDADKIIVMDKGTVADIGTHTELLKRCDIYKNLVQRQMVVSENLV